MSILDMVMSPLEAAERWGIAPVTVRQACSGYKKSPPRFRPDEAKRSGSSWIITVEGMTRLFGQEPK